MHVNFEESKPATSSAERARSHKAKLLIHPPKLGPKPRSCEFAPTVTEHGSEPTSTPFLQKQRAKKVYSMNWLVGEKCVSNLMILSSLKS